MMKKYMLFSLLMIMFSFGLKAQEDVETIEETGHGEDHFSVYHAGVFLGVTNNFEHDVTDFTLGLDYEYRLPFLDYMFGTGFVIEAVFAEHKESILAIPVFIHPPFGGLKFLLAPGVIFGEQVVESTPATHDILTNKKPFTLSEVEGPVETEFKSHFLFRIGAGYDFHINMFSISPTVATDIVDGNFSLVYGLTLGMSL